MAAEDSREPPPQQGESEAPGKDQSGLARELQQAMALGGEAVGLLQSLVRLAGFELLQAVQTAPKIAGVALAAIPIVLMFWVTLTALVSWALYELSGYPLVGWGCACAMQLLLLLVMARLLVVYKRRMVMANTRREVAELVNQLKS